MGPSSAESSVTGSTGGNHLFDYLANFIENSLDAIVAYDSQGCIVFWNLSAERTFGWTKKEALGKGATDLFWPAYTIEEQDDQRQRKLKLDTGEIVQGEHIMLRKDGSLLWVKHSTHAILETGSGVSGYVAVYRDITERKQAEEQLERSNHRLNEILESIQDDFYVLDRDWKFVFTSRSFTSKIGKEPKDFVGNNIWEMFPKHVGGVLYENFYIAMEKREVRRFEIPGKYTDAWYRITAFPSEEGITVLGTDITERKRMVREIESMARFPNENPNPVLRIYHDGAIAFANTASNRLLRLWNCAVGERLPESEYRLVLQTLESRTAVEQEIDCAGRIYSLIFTPIVEGGYVNIYGRDITERKQTEETLNRQRELLQRVFENIPVLLVMWDPNLQRFTLNHHAETVLGWTTADANEGDFMSKVYPDQAERAKISAYMQSLDGGFREWFTTAKSGERIPIDWANIRLTDNTMVGIGVDLREHKQAEESLRAKTEEIDTLLKVSPIAFFVAYDPECTHITANPAGYRLVNLPQDTHRNISKSAPAQVQPTYRVFRDGVELASQDLPMQKAARLGFDVVEESLELRFEDGSSKYIYAYARPLMGENSKPRGAIAAMLDVTERNQAEEKIRASEERFRRLANTVPSIVWIADPDGTIIYTNEYWHKYTGPSSEETGSNWMDFLHPDDFERTVSAWTNAVRTGEDYLIETRLRRDNGQYHWFQARALPVRDGPGTIVAWYGVATDIHDRIEAIHDMRDSQQKLQFLNESLEQKVDEQTAELRRLTANLTKAEQRERSRIAHILHDDLQQRLYAVKMRLSFLTEGQTVDAAVEKEVAELDRQLSEILLLTRHLTIEMSPPVLHDEGLRQAIEWLAFQMEEKLGMRVEVQAEESFAIADEAIQVLLFNCVRELLFNIVKHAGVNQAAVSLQRSGDQLRIEVWDDGKGFDVAGLFRNNKNNLDDTEEVKATFGLPTLRHQLGLLGGQMEIQSEPGAGTRITLTIPFS